MNPRLTAFMELYAQLERDVQALIRTQCGAICELCTSCCCRADLCEEALESPFLQQLHGRETLESDRYGFLTGSGCALEAGRPPVCHEFFCDEILDAQPDPLHRHLLQLLGRLPGHAAERAFGETHLTEILQADDLDHLAFQRLNRQLEESRQALEILRRFFSDGSLPENAVRILNKIRGSAGTDPDE